MIEIPYKLDLIIDTGYEPNKPLEQNNENNKNNENNENNKNKIIANDQEMFNPYVNTEPTQYITKLRQIVLNMGLKDKYFLKSDIKTGFDLKIPLTNINRINDENYSEYVMTNGLVGPIKLNDNSELKKYIDIDVDNLILQPIDFFINNIDDFIKKWNQDYNIYESNIPKIYFYGSILNDSGDLLSYYYIRKKYYNYKDILLNKNFNFAMEYFKKILKLIDYLLSREYIFRNLSMCGMGYEIKNNSFDIIILNYTNFTLLSIEDKYFTQFKLSRCNDKKCAGNLVPYYIIDDYYNLKSNWITRLNKSYSLGLVEIMLLLFYSNDKNLSNVYDFVIGPSIFESQLHWYHFYKRFNSDTNIHNLNLAINELNMKFCNINPIMESELKIILINLLLRDYDEILYPNQIANIIKKVEESNDEFKVEYSVKNKIYNPDDDNYLKSSNNIKQKILSEDEYKNLYLKYKIKYLFLKKSF